MHWFEAPLTIEEKVSIATDLHPNMVQLLETFEYGHLPPHLQEISRPFHDLAWNLAQMPTERGAEKTTALRKLREAKDCAVISALPIGELTKLLRQRPVRHP